MTDYDWFCYELDFANKPCPVVYYGYNELPKSRNDIRVQVRKLSVTDPREYNQLQKLYPYVTDEKKEIPMVRPVTGYMTSQGKFLDTEEEAALYEATYILLETTKKAVKELGVSSDDFVEDAAEKIMAFIDENKKQIETYLEAVKNAEIRPASNGNTSDDSKIRDEGSDEMVETINAETKSEKSRKSSK